MCSFLVQHLVRSWFLEENFCRRWQDAERMYQSWAKNLTEKDIPSMKLTNRTWKWMVGRLVSFWGPAYFQGRLLLVSGRVFEWGNFLQNDHTIKGRSKMVKVIQHLIANLPTPDFCLFFLATPPKHKPWNSCGKISCHFSTYFRNH